MEGVRERLAGVSRAQMLGLVVVVVLAVGAAGLWYMRSLPKPVVISERPAAAVQAQGADPGSAGVAHHATPSSSPSPTVIVDVAGWVREPGVYEFYPDERVIDAVDRAGGPRKGAEVSTLNLAAPLVDGQQILVPPPAARAERGDEGGSDPTDQAGLINVNTASASELESLHGIGEVLAAAIVDHREKNGPFEQVEDLEDVSGIGPVTLENIRADVTV